MKGKLLKTWIFLSVIQARMGEKLRSISLKLLECFLIRIQNSGNN